MIVLFNGRELNSEKYCVYRNIQETLAKNTLLLYFRMLFTMAVSLCTIRIGKNA